MAQYPRRTRQCHLIRLPPRGATANYHRVPTSLLGPPTLPASLPPARLLRLHHDTPLRTAGRVSLWVLGASMGTRTAVVARPHGTVFDRIRPYIDRKNAFPRRHPSAASPLDRHSTTSTRQCPRDRSSKTEGTNSQACASNARPGLPAPTGSPASTKSDAGPSQGRSRRRSSPSRPTSASAGTATSAIPKCSPRPRATNWRPKIRASVPVRHRLGIPH